MRAPTTLAAASILAGTILLAASAWGESLGTYSPLFLNQAEFALAAGDADRTIELLAPRAHRLRNPRERNRAYAALCRAHIDKRDLSTAERSCAEAAEMTVSSWSDFNNRGVVRYLAGDFAGALRFFERAADMNPNDASVLKNIVASRARLQTS